MWRSSVCISIKLDALEVLQREHHSVNKITLHVKPCQQETAQEPAAMSSSLVVLENVPETVTQFMLTMQVENISDLSEQEKDFSIEMIPEINAAVVTFNKSIDTNQFIEAFSQHRLIKQKNITARPLEVTKSIKAENVPSGTSEDYVIVYFEHKKRGGGPVSSVQLLPEENSAVITFQHAEDVNTVLEKKHSIDKQPISVYPYYASLGSALYGKETPQIKMPDPIIISLDPYIWQFLQRETRLIQEINREMANCHCVLKWPHDHSGHPEIKICPSDVMCKWKRSRVNMIKSWREDASRKFSASLSKYKAIEFGVSSAVWEAVKDSLVKASVLIIPDIPKGLLILVGDAEIVKGAEQEIKMLIDNAVKHIEREKQSIEETLSVASGKYAILYSTGLEKKICKEHPGLKISYDASKNKILLYGIAAEVFKVKSEILEKVSNMAQKSINIHPYIVQFLQKVDNRSMLQNLFGRNKINAFYELVGDAVLLTGDSPEVLLEAEEEMRKNVTHKCIDLEDDLVFRKRGWHELTDGLNKKYNSSKEAVAISVLENQVVVAGCFREVAAAHQQLSDFVDQNTQIEKGITVQSVAVVLYVEKEKAPVWLDMKKKGVAIDFGTKTKRKCILLSGPRGEVLKGTTMIEEILSSLYAKDVLVDKPGARAFFKDQEHLYVNGAKEQFNCLIRLQEDGEELEEEGEGSSMAHKKLGQLFYEIVLQDGVVITVYKGDLTRHQVDVVVNAANEDLQHIGGLAGALLNAAGPELQSECDLLVRKRGRLQPGRAVITDAGNLPCKQVIHAVGPRWSHGESEKCVRLLKKAVRESLQLAETYNHQSIAIPAISSGIFGFPLRLCAHSIVTSIKETVAESRDEGCLKQIHLVDSEEKTVQALADALKEVCKDASPPHKLSPKHKSVPQKSPSQSKTGSQLREMREDLQMVTTDEGLRIIMKKGSIEDATTDIIVSSVGQDLQLDKGPLSNALLNKAGSMLQAQLDEEAKGGEVKEGSVFKTNGYNLGCSFVLHAIVPGWGQGQGSVQKILEDIIKECLKITEQLSLNSITFPAVGTGNLGFPKTIVAKLMFDQVFKFSSKKNLKSLQEVHFLLHPTDKDNIRVFSDELQNRLHGNRTKGKVPKSVPKGAQQVPGLCGAIATPAPGVHEMPIGSVTFQVAGGDITKETTDVVVNVSNQTFNLKAGVSKAILDGAGSQVEAECAQLASQPHNNLITTQGGNLVFKKIIHLVAQNDIKALVSKVLQECEQSQYTSVAFPAIGTGQAGRDPVTVADEMMDAVVDFARTNSTPSMKTIKVIIFQPQLQSVFHTCMQKREGTDNASDNTANATEASESESVFSWIKSLFSFGRHTTEKKSTFLLDQKIEPATFQICGESREKVEKAESWIKHLILKDQYEHTISDDWIAKFGKREYDELGDLQGKLHIAFKLNLDQAPDIQVSGVTKDVLRACTEIQDMIKRVRDIEEEQSKADFLKKLIEWQYLDGKGQYKPFDSLTNLRLEEASEGNRKKIEITFQKKCYQVDLANRSAVDRQGNSITILRVSKSEDKRALAVPKEWSDVKPGLVQAVELNPEMKAYQEVKTKFLQTCKNYKIQKIERIQNPYFWQTYQIKKQEMDTKNGHTNNEMCLFHGTSAGSLSIINNKGFNRSYAGLNAAVYGNGTYFAVNANYSAQDTYSKPDAAGKKYMYLARVLVGEYCVGKTGLITPPPKSNTNTTDLFDSVTDSTTHPSMFVTFNDIQAYPEYLITFSL
uniref:Poly [ADP-ribose] polymerase n=1 Tax=Sphenodon punctatus TaxID=8508 RepID=A0A8D0HJ09_SPHPU